MLCQRGYYVIEANTEGQHGQLHRQGKELTRRGEELTLACAAGSSFAGACGLVCCARHFLRLSDGVLQPTYQLTHRLQGSGFRVQGLGARV